MNKDKRKRMDRLLVKRDGQVCGSHLGGCGKTVRSSEANLDHIFPRAFFKDAKYLKPSEYDSLWNLQRTHKTCNEGKGGFLYGFPVFQCECHWLHIREKGRGFSLEVIYKPCSGDLYRRTVVPDGRFQVGGGISDPKGLLPSNGSIVGGFFIQSPEQGMTISNVTVDLRGGRPTFCFVGKSRGALRQGENCHVFPVLERDEVAAFNDAEKARSESGGIVDDNLLDTFNSEVMHWEVER